jgi:hypothetical protein
MKATPSISTDAPLKTFRVFLEIKVQAAFDVECATEEEALALVEQLCPGEDYPVVVDEERFEILSSLGAIALDQIDSAVTYEDCVEEIRQTAEKEKADAKADEKFSKEESRSDSFDRFGR